ncbi:MAG: right-handed parallel beta-helix repeat-containing protein, partial [Candidatus Eisenbacteria bacterium]|nr:right-handed parallel beta-helix repeat-containing protein [Candidatus Eisenbacteria bacterium]
PIIADCGFYSNGDDGLGFGALINPTVRDCVFDGNADYGLYFVNAADSSPPVTGCTFTDNHRPMQIPVNLLPAERQSEGDDNIYSPNEVNVIRFIGRPLTGTDYTFPLEVKHKTDGRIPVTTYDFDSGTVTVGSAYTLEVDPGVVFKGPVGQGITVSGDLRIRGTASEPVVFSVTTDDACGNTAYGESGDSSDTNEDGTATTPSPGSWDGIGVSGSGASAVVRHAVFHYAIDGLTCANMDTIDIRHVIADSSFDNGVSISGGLPATVRDVYLEGNGGDGFYIAQNNATVDSLTSCFSGSHGVRTRSEAAVFTHIVADGNALHGFFIETGDPTLSYATLTGNGGHGLYVQDGYTSPPIEHVTMTGNHIPCRITFSMLSPKRMTEGDTNVYSPNELNIIEVSGNSPVDTLDHEIPFDIKHAGSRTAMPVTTYHLVDNDLHVPAGYTLAVDPGVVVKGAPYNRFCIFDGRLEAVGTEADRIVFTSYRDDTVGNTTYGQGGDSGDTNDDGASSGAPDDWKGIDVDGTGSVRLEHVDMRYGDDNLTMSVDSGLGLIAEIRDSSFDDALDDGLEISGSSGDTLVLEGCRIRDNLDDGLALGAVAGEVRDCVISGNVDRGVSTTSYIKPAFVGNVFVGNGTGLYLYNAAPANLTGNVIAYNDRGVTTGSNNTSLIGGSPAAANSIFGNHTYGVESLDDAPDIVATYNWWGAASGPHDPSDDTGTGGDYNPGGGGDAVTDDVVYRPWVGSGAAGAGRKVTLPAGDGAAMRVPGTGIVIDPQSGPGGEVTVIEIPAKPPADSALVMALKHWLLMSDQLESGSFRLDVCFYLEARDLPAGADPDSLLSCIGDLSDSSWAALPTTVDADSLKFCIENLAELGVFGLGAMSATGVPEVPELPDEGQPDAAIHLLPASRNPFRGETSVSFLLPARATVRLAIYDVAGRLVRVLSDGPHEQGEHCVVWDGADASSNAVSSGVYFCRLESSGLQEQQKLVLLR